MHAHLVQFDIAWESPRENFAHVRRVLGLDTAQDGVGAGAGERMKVRPGDLVCLPEMFDTGFSLNPERTHDEAGATLAFLREIARELKCTVHGSRTLRAPDGRGRNMATVIGADGGVRADYAKIHPFLGTESERFEGGADLATYPWNSGRGDVRAGDAASIRVGVAICYDLRFPELFRALALGRTGAALHRAFRALGDSGPPGTPSDPHAGGAEMFVIGANWPLARAHHWRALLIARAIENQAYVLGINRVGRDPNLAYNGGSIAVGPKGDVLGELDDREGVLSVEIDPALVRQWRGSFPALRDARMV